MWTFRRRYQPAVGRTFLCRRRRHPGRDRLLLVSSSRSRPQMASAAACRRSHRLSTPDVNWSYSRCDCTPVCCRSAAAATSKQAKFLSRDAMRKRGLCCRPVSVRPSVRPSVCLVCHVVHCIHTAEDIVRLISRPDSPIILVF